jgi:hypothetical protein
VRGRRIEVPFHPVVVWEAFWFDDSVLKGCLDLRIRDGQILLRII